MSIRELLRLGDTRLHGDMASYAVLQAVQSFLPFLTIPLLTHALGVEGYGRLAIALAVASYVTIWMDFGFSLSGSREISRLVDSPEAMRAAYWEIQSAKGVLGIFAIAAVAIAAQLVATRQTAQFATFAAAGSVAGNLAFPVWFLEGRRAFKHVAGAAIAGRLLQLAILFAFVNEPRHLILALGAELSVNVVAGLLVSRAYWSEMSRPSFSAARAFMRLRTNAHLFLANAGVGLYSGAGVLILGLFAPASAVGLFALADRVLAAAKSTLKPVSSNALPRLAALAPDESAFRVAQRSYAPLFVAIGGATSLGMFALAKPGILLLAGSGFSDSATLVQIMSPIPLLVSISNFFGVQTLLARHADALYANIILLCCAVGLALNIVCAHYWQQWGSAYAVLASEALASLLMAVFAARHSFLGKASNP